MKRALKYIPAQNVVAELRIFIATVGIVVQNLKNRKTKIKKEKKRGIHVRYIIAGGRNFQNYALMEETLNSLNLNSDDEIVSGDARGADTLGAEYGTRHGIPVIHFPADWDRYGNAAGPIRNEEMAEYGDYLVAFWDGKSRGTAHMIQAMKRKGKHGKVVRY